MLVKKLQGSGPQEPRNPGYDSNSRLTHTQLQEIDPHFIYHIC